MPVNSTLQYVRALLDGATVPGNSGKYLEAFVTPPDPETESRNPHAYVWAARGPENRVSGKRSTPPAGAPQYAPVMPAGWKMLKHTVEVYLTWFDDNLDPQADSSFPWVLDFAMNAIRCCRMPVDLIDPGTGLNCQLINLGEVMSYEYNPLRSTASQRFKRQDALITAPVEEWIQALWPCSCSRATSP